MSVAFEESGMSPSFDQITDRITALVASTSRSYSFGHGICVFVCARVVICVYHHRDVHISVSTDYIAHGVTDPESYVKDLNTNEIAGQTKCFPRSKNTAVTLFVQDQTQNIRMCRDMALLA